MVRLSAQAASTARGSRTGKGKSNPSSGVSSPQIGGTTRCCNARIVAIASSAPVAPSVWPNAPLVAKTVGGVGEPPNNAW